MKKVFTLFMTVLVAAQVWAIVPPKGAASLTDGTTYAFQNVHKMTSWLGHTSWDGALYYNNASADNYVQLTAISNQDGTWSFTEVLADGDTLVKYLVIPNGTDNFNTKTLENCPDPETIPCFTVQSVGDGVLRLIVGQGNNLNCVDRPMHMNAGNEYVVASEPINGGGWYPDFYGGSLKDEYDLPVYEGETDLMVMADSTTCNWNFVEPANIETYMGMAEGYSKIADYEANYVSNEEIEEEYAAGFLATYNAACAVYEGEEYEYALDNPTIIAMIDAKVNLYKEILVAIEANVDDDAALGAAIDAAKTAFTNSTDAAALEAAYNTLFNAVKAYKEGTGDLTSLIQNNSFEDLSSQDGSQTVNVAGAPTGWNVYVNGKQVVTAAEVKAAGIANWHGINNDADGELDGTVAFGIWTSGVPTYELSQTIEGLENGTYIVEASLMAGANNNGSRMTTQRIFANLNSTYFGNQEDYDEDELDKSELYGFQGNDQNYVTDRTLFPMELKAYVYDGTLTLGLRTDGNYRATFRSSGNSAGGDGWFKVDNFRLQKVGYVAEDAFDIFEHFYSTLIEYLDGEDMMAEAVKDELNDIKRQYADYTVDTPAEDLNAAILACRDEVSVVAANIKAYQELYDAIQTAWEGVEEYSDYPGAGDYADAVMEIEDNYNNGVYSTEECATAIQALADAKQACIESNVVEPGKDITNWIKNPSFEDLTSQNGSNSDGVQAPPTGWRIIIDGDECTTLADMTSHTSGWCAINSGDAISIEDEEGTVWEHQYTDGEHLWGLWSGSVPAVELFQELNLPAGTYKLSADIVVQNDWAGYNLATQRLFGGDYVTMFGAEDKYATYLPEDAVAAQKHDSWTPEAEYKYLQFAENYKEVSYDISGIPYTTTVVFGTEGTAPVKVGFRTDRTDLTTGELSTQASMGWFKLDNFRLECVNLEVPDGIEAAEQQVAVSKEQVAGIYNLAGQRVDAGYRGIVISAGKKVMK